MTRRLLLSLAAAILVTWTIEARQGGVSIRMATIVPSGSLWDRHLRDMGEQWKQATGGRVTLTVFPGGTMGDETTVVRKLRFESPQAAALSTIGLSRIDDAFGLFGVPFFFASYEELHAVLGELTPTLRQRLDERGLVLLAWGHVGWAHLFTTTPVRSFDDLKRITIFTSAGDTRMVEWYRTNGFRPRALATTDILTGLTGGLIEGVPAPPAAVLAFQWFRQAKFMLSRGIAPVIGAVVIGRRTWDSLGEPDRQQMRRAALEFERRINADVPRVEQESIAEMQKRGLTVIPAEERAWEASARSMASSLPGVPPEILSQAQQARDTFRLRAAR